MVKSSHHGMEYLLKKIIRHILLSKRCVLSGITINYLVLKLLGYSPAPSNCMTEILRSHACMEYEEEQDSVCLGKEDGQYTRLRYEL